MGAEVMRSTDILGIGKVFEAFDRPSLTIEHKTKPKKGAQTTFTLNISKFDTIVGLIVVSALYIAMKRHMQGQSASEGFYGSMLTQNPLNMGLMNTSGASGLPFGASAVGSPVAAGTQAVTGGNWTWLPIVGPIPRSWLPYG